VRLLVAFNNTLTDEDESMFNFTSLPVDCLHLLCCLSVCNMIFAGVEYLASSRRALMGSLLLD
jgi:hypothetical protein